MSLLICNRIRILEGGVTLQVEVKYRQFAEGRDTQILSDKVKCFTNTSRIKEANPQNGRVRQNRRAAFGIAPKAWQKLYPPFR